MGFRTIKIREAEYRLLKELSEKEGRPISAIASDALDLYAGHKKPELVGAKVKEILEIHDEISKLLERSKRLHKLLSAAQEGYYPSPFAESEVERAAQTGVIQAKPDDETDEVLRRKLNEIAVEFVSLLEALEAAKEQHDRIIQQSRSLFQQYESIVFQM